MIVKKTKHNHVLEVSYEKEGDPMPRYARFSRRYVDMRSKDVPLKQLELLKGSIVEQDEDSVTYDMRHEGWRAIESMRAGLQEKKEKEKWDGALARIGHGLWGMVKSKFKIDPSSDDVIHYRLEICGECDKNTPCIGSSKKRCCGKLLDVLKATSPTCGCVISNKVTVASEKCPLGKW